MQKSAAKYIVEDYHQSFADVDRYSSDRLDCFVSLRGSKTGYDVSFQVNAAQLGIASNVQYWHYVNGEYKEAHQTFLKIKEAVKQIVHEVENNKIPFSNIGPMTRNALGEIDLPHKERSGVAQYNDNQKNSFAPDWRTTLYGNRYPGHDIQNQKKMVINTTEAVRLISEGEGRNKTQKLQTESFIINKAKI